MLIKPRDIFVPAFFLTGLALVFGCGVKKPAQFEPNMVFAKSLEIRSGYPMKKALDQTQDALKAVFGSAGKPQLPKILLDNEFAELVRLDRIVSSSTSSRLYEKHCAVCHGLEGNGRGVTAALLDPYPRDYRAGKFKYKSTPRGVKPLRTDLEYVIRHGIDGTSMKAIPELSDSDVQLLVDYVVFLSVRGELERNLLRLSADIDFENNEILFDEKMATSNPAKYEEQLKVVEEVLLEIAEKWLEAADRVKAIPRPPADLPVPATRAEVLVAASSLEDSALRKSIMRGRELFQSESAACAKCHGKEGYGDGQTQDYDDWTKEWTTQIGIDPNNESSQIPLIARGALPARRILPRDFRLGQFRGGSEPEKIYRRIVEGIDGSPMPASSLASEDVWHLVNYVRSFESTSPAIDDASVKN